MSLFNNPNEKLKKAVEWFSSLKSEQQALLIANLSNPDSTFTSEQTDNLTEITLEIAAALSSYVSKQQM